ncbi:MAG TPA: cytochrome c [Candidatus Dormibacteraeota bacterium]
MPAGIVRQVLVGSGLLLLGALLAGATVSALAETSPSPSTSGGAGASPAPSGSAGALPGDPTKGATLYGQTCATCHGASLDGGIGPKLNPLQKISGVPPYKRVDEPQVVQYLITTITDGKAPSDGYGQMPAKGGKPSLTDQDVKDIAAFIIQTNLGGKTTLGPVELARSNVFWVTVGVGLMVFITFLLARYNMRWIARRAAARPRQP